MQIEQLEAKEASPRIADLSSVHTRRLIDDGMIHYEASLAGLAERYGRGNTSHTIHVWWARRPHSAMRALVFASLCRESSEKALEILSSIGSKPTASPSDLDKARQLLRGQYGRRPRLLDMFGGGGTIPMEACTLGAETYACDANELSVFIQQCNLQYSQQLSKAELINGLRTSGNSVLRQLEQDTATLFPLRKKHLFGTDKSSVFGYLWTYSMECSNCGYSFYLSKRRWLSKKQGKQLRLVFHDNGDRQTVAFEIPKSQNKQKSAWIGRSSTVVCPKCGTKNSNVNIKHCRDELIAVIKPAQRRGKEFASVPDDAVPEIGVLRELEEATLQELGINLPQSRLPHWSGIVNPALYGIETHADFLNPRQRVVLLLLIKSLCDEYHRLCAEHDSVFAKCIVGFLSSLVDQVVDWNCRLSMWISENEQVGRAFSGPGVAMFWDYAETDQLLKGPANLWAKLDRIIEGAKSIPRFGQIPKIQVAFAQELPFEDDYFDAIVTDPPYYDNIYYSILADFFYVWKQPILELIDAEHYRSNTTNSIGELVASRMRSGTAAKAHSDYCEQLSKALKEAERVLKLDGVFVLVYSHGSLQGWEAIVKSYRTTGLVIGSAQPLSIERRQRPRAMTSETRNTCIAFVARRSAEKRRPITLAELHKKLMDYFIPFAEALLEAGWNEGDAGLAAFTNSVGMLANASSLAGYEEDDLAALKHCVDMVQERFPSFTMKSRNSL